jgi:hypothetical protein
MSESRVKAIKHQRIRNGEFPCVYCGGIILASEPDHMPPRILFSRKQRPNDLVFPSCSECNRGSAAIDTIIAWLGRSYPDSVDPKEREEVRSIGASMGSNYPEVASAFYTKEDPPLTLAQRAALQGRTTPVNVDDPYVHRCIEFFGAKFGFAMHWRFTGGQPTSRGQRPGASARAFVLAAAATLAGAGANGAGMAKRLRGPLWGRMSPQAAAEHLWARKGSGAFGFAREREASALTGDIARFWSKVREALDRLDVNTTTDGWSI